MKDMGKKFKKWAAMGLLYTAFCAVFMAPILIPLKKEMEEKRVAKLAAEQRREESRRTEAALKAIGAMAQEYPQRSETMAEEEIPKVARGGTVTLRFPKMVIRADHYGSGTCGYVMGEGGPEPITFDLNNEEVVREKSWSWRISRDFSSPPYSASYAVWHWDKDEDYPEPPETNPSITDYRDGWSIDPAFQFPTEGSYTPTACENFVHDRSDLHVELGTNLSVNVNVPEDAVPGVYSLSMSQQVVILYKTPNKYHKDVWIYAPVFMVEEDYTLNNWKGEVSPKFEVVCMDVKIRHLGKL